MLHFLHTGFDHDRARRNHGAGQLGSRRPAPDAAGEEHGDGQTREIKPADRAAGVQFARTHCRPLSAVLPTTLRLPGAAGAVRCAKTLRKISSRGPKPCCTPLASTRSRSQAESVAGRCAISTTIALRALRSMIAWCKAVSPSPSRFAFGSSRTTRNGSPYKAPCERDALPLPPRQHHTAFADSRVIAG